jgi:hypothetical protein
MTWKTLKTAAVLAGVVVGIGVCPFVARASDAPPDDKKKAAEAAKANQVEGTLAAVDVSRNSIRVVSTFKDPNTGQKSEMDRTFPVAADAKIFLTDPNKEKTKGAVVKLADLKDGMRVVVLLSEDKKTATEIRATVKDTSVTAGLKSVDAEKRMLTVATKDKQSGQQGAQSYAVAADATVVFLGHEKKGETPGKLSDLKEGMGVTLRMSEDGKTVVAIRVAAPTAQGVVKGVDAAKNTITVTIGAKNTAMDVTYELDKAATVQIDGKSGQLTDLKVGTQVQLLLSRENSGVVGVRAGAKGKVK